MHYFCKNSLHYFRYFELLSNRNFTILKETVQLHHFKKFVSSLVPRLQIPSRKQLSIELLDDKFQMIPYLLKTGLILLTVFKCLEFTVLYDSLSSE